MPNKVKKVEQCLECGEPKDDCICDLTNRIDEEIDISGSFRDEDRYQDDDEDDDYI